MRTTRTWEWDWVSVVLLFLMLQVAAARLVSTEWAPQLPWTGTLAALGMVLGLALGWSQFRRGAVSALVGLYTITVVPWQISRSATDPLLIDRLNRVGWTMAISFNQFFHRQPVKDTLFFIAFVCLAFWLLGIGSGYWLARHGRVLRSIVLTGAAIVVVQVYGNSQPRGSWWLALFVLMALLLAGRVYFQQQKRSWVDDRVFVSEDSGTNLLATVFMTAAVAVLAAWWLPSSMGSIKQAAETWNDFYGPLRERLSNAVTSLSDPYARPHADFYGRTLPLGKEAAAGDTIVLTVETIKVPAIHPRYYWRGRTYNVYQDGVWSAATDSVVAFTPGVEALEIPDATHRAEAQFLITSNFLSQALLYGPSSTVWVDRAAEVEAVRAATNVYDAFSWESTSLISAGSSYQVRAELRNPTVRDLQTAGTSYPAWITEQYLGVPQADREALRRLAGDITVGAQNTYDKTAAITNYLRQHIQYAPSVPAAPAGEDPVTWVLFDYRKGFCNYYASAEVLLLRSIGIPARLAVGFARGDLEEDLYKVHRRDAHAWPEVYFTGIGWVEFEPTSIQDPLVRPSGTQSADDETAGLLGGGLQTEGSLAPEERLPEDILIAPPGAPLPFFLTPAGRALSTAVPLLLALVGIVLVYRFRVASRLPAYLSRTLEAGGGPAPGWLRDWVRWNQSEPIERIFASVSWTLRLLGNPQPTSATPAAQAAALARLLPSAADAITVLGAELESGLFTRRPANLARARSAALVVLLHGLRARIRNTLALLNGRAVYSVHESESPNRGKS